MCFIFIHVKINSFNQSINQPTNQSINQDQQKTEEQMDRFIPNRSEPDLESSFLELSPAPFRPTMIQ